MLTGEEFDKKQFRVKLGPGPLEQGKPDPAG